MPVIVLEKEIDSGLHYVKYIDFGASDPPHAKVAEAVNYFQKTLDGCFHLPDISKNDKYPFFEIRVEDTPDKKWSYYAYWEYKKHYYHITARANTQKRVEFFGDSFFKAVFQKGIFRSPSYTRSIGRTSIPCIEQPKETLSFIVVNKHGSSIELVN